MSGLGQKQTWRYVRVMSALPLKAIQLRAITGHADKTGLRCSSNAEPLQLAVKINIIHRAVGRCSSRANCTSRPAACRPQFPMTIAQ
jgi:hypothetical protein